MKKKFLALAMSTIMLLACSASNVLAAETAAPRVAPVEIDIDYNSAKANANGTTTYDVVNADEIAAYYGVDDPKEVSVTMFNRARQVVPAPRSVYIDNIQPPREACGSNEITRNSAYNSSDKTVTKTVTLTGGVSNTYSTNIEAGFSVDIASISAGVGFDVTASWEMTDSTEVTLSPGESVDVYAYPLYDIYRFDIINDPFFGGAETIGYGDAYECMGFCTVVR